MKTHTLCLLNLVACCTVHAASYPEALNDAAINVERLDSILDHSLIVGNGDINALVWNERGATTLMLTMTLTT